MPVIRTLVVMAKTPRIGHGKSGLARDVGRVPAWRINCALHAHTFRIARDRRWHLTIAVTPDRDVRARLPGVWPKDAVRHGQGQGDLGARMTRALHRVRGAVAIIGTDCPDATRADIASAFAALARAPIAIGAATDGGFWILAARRARDATKAFRAVRWSSPHTLADVQARLRGPIARVRTLSDIDTAEDWRAYLRRRNA